LPLEEPKKGLHHITPQKGYTETNQGEQQSQELEEFAMSSRKWARIKLVWEDGHGSPSVVVLPQHALLVHIFQGDQTDSQKAEQYGNNTRVTLKEKGT
jgi:hypothetical protein